MENNLLDEIEIREINGYRTLRLGNKYHGKKMIKHPIFKKWYEEEKSKINKKFRIDEKINEILFCTSCKRYIYDTGKYFYNINCCEKPLFYQVCIYCGYIFYPEDYCCLRNSIKYCFKEYLIDGRYFCSWFEKDCIKSVPIIFKFLFVKTIMKAFFFRRQIGPEDYDSYGEKETKLFKLTLKITFLIELVYIFVFYFPLTIAYLIYLYFYFQISIIQ